MRQNAADSNSPLDCSPECPQEEYVYDYQYAGSDTGDEFYMNIIFTKIIYSIKAVS